MCDTSPIEEIYARYNLKESCIFHPNLGLALLFPCAKSDACGFPLGRSEDHLRCALIAPGADVGLLLLLILIVNMRGEWRTSQTCETTLRLFEGGSKMNLASTLNDDIKKAK